jgi:hypothetical protein
MGAIGSCCCLEECGTSNITSLPTLLRYGAGTYYDTTITNSEWTSGTGVSSADPCCWWVRKSLGLNLPPIGLYEYQCSTAFGIPPPQLDRLMVMSRWRNRLTFILTKQTCQCDSQPSPVSQYVLTVIETWNYSLGLPFVFYVDCLPYAHALHFRNYAFESPVVRRIYFPTATTGTYTLLQTDTPDCNDSCDDWSYANNSFDTSITIAGNTRTISWDYPGSWTVDLTF